MSSAFFSSDSACAVIVQVPVHLAQLGHYGGRLRTLLAQLLVVNLQRLLQERFGLVVLAFRNQHGPDVQVGVAHIDAFGVLVFSMKNKARRKALSASLSLFSAR